MGDFNCDGLASNSAISGCNCTSDVVCPTAELQFAPFPAPGAIPLIDGSLWVDATKRPDVGRFADDSEDSPLYQALVSFAPAASLPGPRP